MKILQITFNLSSGGAERFVVDLSNELVKDNDVVLMTLMDDKVEPEKNQFYLFDLDKRVKYKNLGIKKGGGFKFSVLWKVYKAMKKERAEVIHLHVRGVVNFCLLGIFLLCWRTTIVQTIHIDFKLHSTLVYKILFNTIGRLHKMRWAALSESNYEDLKQAYPYVLCQRIDNGRSPMHPTNEFEKVKAEIAKYKKTNNTKVLLHIARCAEQKNQQLLIASVNELKIKGNDVILLIIGDGFDSELGQQLKNNSGEGIYYLGTRKNISDYMLNSDLFCLSSSYEGLPITILEALLSGVPVVSTPVAGAKDVIKNSVTGVISSDYSETKYVNALEYALNNLIVLKDNCMVEKDCSPYTMEACAKKYLAFYTE